MGSDVQRDGMYLELDDVIDADPKTLAEGFHSDMDGSVTATRCARRIAADELTCSKQKLCSDDHLQIDLSEVASRRARSLSRRRSVEIFANKPRGAQMSGLAAAGSFTVVDASTIPAGGRFGNDHCT